MLYQVSEIWKQHFHLFLCADRHIWRDRNEVQLWTGLDWQKVACNFLCLVLWSAVEIFYSESLYLLPFISNWNILLSYFFQQLFFYRQNFRHYQFLSFVRNSKCPRSYDASDIHILFSRETFYVSDSTDLGLNFIFVQFKFVWLVF